MLLYLAFVSASVILAALNCFIPAVILAVIALLIAFRPELDRVRSRSRGPHPA